MAMTPKKRRILIQWLLFLLFGIGLFTLIIVSGCNYFRAERKSKYTPTFWALGNNSQYNVTALQSSLNVLSLGLGFSSFDPTKGLKMEMAFNPRNNLTTPGATPILPVCITYGDKDLSFKPLEEMSPTTFSLAFTGEQSYYPFDIYHGELYINAHVGNATSNETCVSPLPLSPAIVGSAQDFVVTTLVTPGWDDDTNQFDYSTALIQFTISRTPLVRFMSLLTFAVMWFLTAIIFTIAFWVWKSGRRTELGLVAISTGLMYALPRLRETQPGIPKQIGTALDMFGYLWNVFIVACCVVAQLLNYVVRKNAKKW